MTTELFRNAASVFATSVGWNRVHVGCGPCAQSGWINVDRLRAPGVDVVCDIAHGIPLPPAAFDYIVAMHVLQDLPYSDIAPCLAELCRLLKGGGVLRLGLPDLEKAMMAYMLGDDRYFYVPDEDAVDIGAKLVTQITWYGSVRTPMTYGFVREQLIRSGFRTVHRCDFHQTRGPHPEIVSLDNRARESLYVEAVR
jgi:SAM-dependent methyltransferase